MAAAVGVLQHLKDIKSNILGERENIEIEEFPSEYSDDYNVSHGSEQLGKNVKIVSGRSLSCHHLPSNSQASRTPSLSSRRSSVRRKLFLDDGKVLGGQGDSGFNSDPGSCSGVSVPSMSTQILLCIGL